MDPFARWQQVGLTFELYDAGEALLYVEQDLVWRQAWGGDPQGDLSFLKEMLGPEEWKRFDERLDFETWVRWNGYPSLESAVRRHLDEWQCVKYLPQLQHILMEHEYNDNYRFAPIDDAEAVKEYHRQAEKGCCGSYDEQMEIDGRLFLFGFNWGH